MPHSHGYWQEVSIPCHMGLANCCSSLIMTWQLGSPRVSDLRGSKTRSHNVFMTQTVNVMLHHFCDILLITQVSSVHYGRGLYKGMYQEVAICMGSVWRLATTFSNVDIKLVFRKDTSNIFRK